MICNRCYHYDVHNQECKYPILYEDVMFKDYDIVSCEHFILNMGD